MAAAAGVFSQISGAPARTGKAAPMASTSSGTNGTASSSAGSATISANDFLTLLVTEMQNQDPTAQTDPNEYINQLVAVNSLEQLIGINQTLAGALGTTTGSSNASPPAPQAAASATSLQMPHSTAVPANAENASKAPASHPVPELTVRGNLGIPAANPAAERVAHALDGRSGGMNGTMSGISISKIR